MAYGRFLNGGTPKSAKIVNPSGSFASSNVFNDLILQFSARKKLIEKGANTKHLSSIGGDLFTSATGSQMSFFLGGCDFLGNDPSVCELTTMSTSRNPWEFFDLTFF